LPKEVSSNDLMLGDRRTFLGETSIRVLEKRLGIQRDQTLRYQSSYRSNQFSSGQYNDGAVRGGYNNYGAGKRTADPPAYQLGRQSYNQHKRVKTGEDSYSYSKQANNSNDAYNPLMPAQSRTAQPGYYGGHHIPQAFPPQPYPGLPIRNPNESVPVPHANAYASFGQGPAHQNQTGRAEGGEGRPSINDRREGKKDTNRFSDLGS